MARKYSTGAGKKVERAMHERKRGTRKSASTGKKGSEGKQVIGLLTEAHALRRYSEELDRARRDIVGEI